MKTEDVVKQLESLDFKCKIKKLPRYDRDVIYINDYKFVLYYGLMKLYKDRISDLVEIIIQMTLYKDENIRQGIEYAFLKIHNICEYKYSKDYVLTDMDDIFCIKCNVTQKEINDFLKDIKDKDIENTLNRVMNDVRYSL